MREIIYNITQKAAGRRITLTNLTEEFTKDNLLGIINKTQGEVLYTPLQLGNIQTFQYQNGSILITLSSSVPSINAGDELFVKLYSDKEIDLSAFAKESTLLAESQVIQSAIQNIDLSSVEGKVEEVKQAVDNIDLTPIENKVQEGVNFLSVLIDNIDLSKVENKVQEESTAIQNKIDNIKLPEIDTSELAKQGENPEATNSKILEEVQNKLTPLEAVLTELNNGKQEMVNALATKNVQSSTSKTLSDIANDVRNIAQAPITIDGGEMYEKQLFGAATDKTNAYEQPDSILWNFYQVMANLLSDGRFIEYQGIALCEYDAWEDTISLNSSGTGGAYFTSDLEFIEYDTEYVWKDIDHTKLNRWVAYLFYSSSKTFEIPKNTINLYVGRNIGKVVYSQSDKKLVNIVTEFGDIGELDMVSRYTNKGIFYVRGIQQNSESTIIDATAITSIIIDGIEINYPIIDVDKTHILDTIYVKSIKSNVKNGSDLLRVLTYNNMSKGTLEVNKIVIEDGLEWGTVGLIRGNRVRKSSANGKTMEIYGIKTLKSPIISSEFQADFDTTEYMEFPDLLSLECSPIKANTNNGFGSHLSAIIAKNATLKSLDMNKVSFYNLIDLDFKSIEGSIYGNKWSNVDIINDPDKMALLNKNIREHIVARAIDGNNTLTFTINNSLYAKLEQETLDAFAAKNWIVAGA